MHQITHLARRARAYQSLTPTERALLRLLEGLAYVALVGGITDAAQYLATPAGAGGAIDWAAVGRVCLAGATVATLMALAKYFKAHSDPALTGTPAPTDAPEAPGNTVSGAVDTLGAHIAAQAARSPNDASD